MKAQDLITAVHRIPKTSLEEAGILPVNLKEGAPVLAIGHPLWPDHDRGLTEGVLRPLIERLRPRLILMLGGVLHDGAWDELAPGEIARRNKRGVVHLRSIAPEVEIARMHHYEWEDKVDSLFRQAGSWIASWAEIADSRVIYIPSASQLMPRETELMQHLIQVREAVVGYRKSEERKATRAGNDAYVPYDGGRIGRIIDAPTRELDSSQALAQFLAIDDPRVDVYRFGGAALINDRVLAMIGDFRRRNPLTAAATEMYARGFSVIRAFDGKTANLYFTQPGAALPNRRRYYQGSEFGGLFDRQRMGNLTDYNFWSHGFYFGRVVRGTILGQSYVFQRGLDGRRGVVVDGVPFFEPTPGGLGRVEPAAVID